MLSGIPDVVTTAIVEAGTCLPDFLEATLKECAPQKTHSFISIEQGERVANPQPSCENGVNPGTQTRSDRSCGCTFLENGLPSARPTAPRCRWLLIHTRCPKRESSYPFSFSLSKSESRCNTYTLMQIVARNPLLFSLNPEPEVAATRGEAPHRPHPEIDVNLPPSKGHSSGPHL